LAGIADLGFFVYRQVPVFSKSFHVVHWWFSNKPFVLAIEMGPVLIARPCNRGPSARRSTAPLPSAGVAVSISGCGP